MMSVEESSSELIHIGSAAFPSVIRIYIFLLCIMFYINHEYSIFTFYNMVVFTGILYFTGFHFTFCSSLFRCAWLIRSAGLRFIYYCS